MPRKLRTPGMLPVIAALAAVSAPASAQGDPIDSAKTALREYVACLNAYAAECIESFRLPFGDEDSQDRLAFLRRSTVAAQQVGLFDFVYWRLDVAQPFEVAGSDDKTYVVSAYQVVTNVYEWEERIGYLVGVSANGEQGWRFVENTLVPDIDFIVPDYRGPELPETASQTVSAPDLATSDYLRTTSAGFLLRDVGDSAYFELTLATRKRIRRDIPLVVAFENPEDSGQPYVIESVLARGQKELHLSSPLVSGIQAGQSLQVRILGIGEDSSEVLFEHTQPMLFYPVPDHDGRIIPGTEPVFPSTSILQEYMRTLRPPPEGAVELSPGSPLYRCLGGCG